MDLLTGQTWGKLATECRLDQVIDHKNSWEGTEKIKPLSSPTQEMFTYSGS